MVVVLVVVCRGLEEDEYKEYLVPGIHYYHTWYDTDMISLELAEDSKKCDKWFVYTEQKS